MSENALENALETPIHIQEGSTQLIYADRIVGFALGPAVSKLTLGMEVGPTVFNPTVTLVIPTSSLLDTMAFFEKTIHDNEALKAELTKGLDAIKEQYNKL